MVDLKAKPFYLEDEAIKWVEETIASMTIEEKIGQLFVNLCASRKEEDLADVATKYHIGAARYNPGTAKEIYEQNRILQENAKIPLLIAANMEGGGDGACSDGTVIGQPVKIGATGDSKYAYEMGRVSGEEGVAVGCNWTFAPLVDINQNWRNPIISNRCFSNKAEDVLDNGIQYFKGISESNMICAMKHFPGDGLDERDQHLSNSVNTATCEEWDETYGKIYAGLIEEGIQSVMVGHIMQPAYTRYFNPEIADEDIMPATLSKELVTDLLRGKLGFNGLVVTDASHMVGMTCMKKRRDMLPASIAAGCDIFLFFNDLDEDFDAMLKGYKEGIITEERLKDALSRILGAKAMLGLHKKAKTDLVPEKEGLSIVGSKEHKAMAKEVAEKAITLVKNKQEIFPLTPEKTKRLLLVPAKASGGTGFLASLQAGSGKTPFEIMAEILREKGFDVEIFKSPLENITAENKDAALAAYFGGKTRVDDFVGKYDAILTVGNVNGMGQTTERVSWSFSKGGGEIPWYTHEIPVIVISLKSPFMLVDVPHVKTYINAYDATPTTIETVIEKMMGVSEFVGTDPVDAFCGLWDTRI
ncbi:MAG: glycoside hydrolase family 3 N-terminal domain-containing protein [Eubacterium sp.]